MSDNDEMTTMKQTAMIGELRKVLKRLHYPLEVMLVCARWYAAYPLSFGKTPSPRHLEEMMQERGVFVDHSAVHRGSLKILPVLALIFRRRKRPVGLSWRIDETYIKVAGQWKYLYRAVDKAGDTVDFLLTAKRELAAARRYLVRAINLHGLPEKITIDKSGANMADIKSVNVDACLNIELRQSKYLNNIVEQDHRAVKRITEPMMGFKSFWSAQKLIAGIETMHKVKKWQLHYPGRQAMSAANQFYSLAF
jgi:putative transposase